MTYCDKCQVSAKRPLNAYLSSWPETTKPMERIHIDVGNWQNNNFLLVVDAFSHWIDVQPLQNTTSNMIIEKLRNVFKCMGLPHSIVSDNCSNFVSDEIETFFRKCNIRHIKTPMYHHQSNGLAEKYIDVFKQFVRKHGYSTCSIANFVLFSNTTPSANPSQLKPWDLGLSKAYSSFDSWAGD